MRYRLLSILCVILASQTTLAQNSWQRLNSGVDDWLSDAAFVSPDIGWVIGTSDTLYYTNNGGAQWTSISIPLDSAMKDLIFQRVRFISDSTGFLVGSYRNSITGMKRTLILRTSDQGITWAPATADTLGTIFDITFPTPTLGYACGTAFSPNYSDFLAITTDGGNTWSYATDRSNQFFFRIVFRDSLSGMGIYSTEPYTVAATTTNGGKTWEDIKTEILLKNDIAYIGETKWLLATSSGILQSIDDGKSWRKVDSTSYASAFGFYGSHLGYCVSGDYGSPWTIRKTTDGGSSWKIHDTQISSILSINAIAVPSENVAYAVGANGMIIKTTDGGGPPLSINEPQPEAHKILTITHKLIADRLHCSFTATDYSRSLLIYDLLGQTVRLESIETGATTLELDASALSPGAYWCRLGDEVAQFMVVR